MRTPDGARAHAHHVLIVDDDASIRTVMADLLLDTGYTVEVARDIPSAVRALDRAPLAVCLVLLDVMLPSGDGLDVLSHLRATSKRIPVVALSASDERLAAAKRAGATATLSKPFELDQLLNVVARWCTDSPL
jgi:CheY-like chemotaxis protein